MRSLSIPGLKEVQRYALGIDGGTIKGGVFVSPGEENLVSIQVFDEQGEHPIYKGEGFAVVGKEGTSEFHIPLDGPESSFPVYARLGDKLLSAGIVPSELDGLMLQLTLLDPLGNHIEFGPDDLEWKLPEGFPDPPVFLLQQFALHPRMEADSRTGSHLLLFTSTSSTERAASPTRRQIRGASTPESPWARITLAL